MKERTQSNANKIKTLAADAIARKTCVFDGCNFCPAGKGLFGRPHAEDCPCSPTFISDMLEKRPSDLFAYIGKIKILCDTGRFKRIPKLTQEQKDLQKKWVVTGEQLSTPLVVLLRPHFETDKDMAIWLRNVNLRHTIARRQKYPVLTAVVKNKESKIKNFKDRKKLYQSFIAQLIKEDSQITRVQ